MLICCYCVSLDNSSELAPLIILSVYCFIDGVCEHDTLSSTVGLAIIVASRYFVAWIAQRIINTHMMCAWFIFLVHTVGLGNEDKV